MRKSAIEARAEAIYAAELPRQPHETEGHHKLRLIRSTLAQDRWEGARMTGATVGGVGCYFTPMALGLFMLVAVLAVIGLAS